MKVTTQAHDERLEKGIAQTLYAVTGMYQNEMAARHHAKEIVKKVRALGWYPQPQQKLRHSIMKTTLSILAISALLIGCTTPTPTPPKPPTTTQTVTEVNRLIDAGYDSLNALDKWQNRHRAQLKNEPALQKLLKDAKAKLWDGIEASTKRLDAFEKDATDDARLKLEQALIELNKALDNSAKFLAERATRQKVR